MARDIAGNQQIAVAAIVTVTNDTTPPTVTMTSPAASGIVGGALTLAGIGTAIVIAMWFAFYLFVFLPRGALQ